MARRTASGDGGVERGAVRISRRRFVAGIGAAAAAPYFVPATSLGAPDRAAPSERIGLGVIGTGGRGSGHVRAMLGTRDVQVLAVCDADRARAEPNKKAVDGRYRSSDCLCTTDFRELLAHKGIDAVIIASPENWHALQAAKAAEAGKDVYCEKALSLTVREGRQLIRTVRRYGAVFQVGTQQRSDRNFRRACELARNGYLGTLKRVKVHVPGGRALPNASATKPPPSLDYDTWLGPAPWTPHNDLKCKFNWYFIYDYCAGWIQSWGVHHCDIALWGAPELGRGRIRTEGTAVFPTDGIADTSIHWDVKYHTPSGLVYHFTDGAGERVTFTGTEGQVQVWRGGISAEPMSLAKVAFKATDERLYESRDHYRNWLECIRNRCDCVAPVEAGHAATTISLVGDIATRLRRRLTWDWTDQSFVDDEIANKMLARSMRAPWTL